MPAHDSHRLAHRAPLTALALALAANGVPPERAAAHETASGWRYDSWCCGGKDCQPIDRDQVTITPEGFLVSIPGASHATALRDHVKLFAYDSVRRSGDEHFHACILPHSQDFRCLYVPDFTQ